MAMQPSMFSMHTLYHLANICARPPATAIGQYNHYFLHLVDAITNPHTASILMVSSPVANVVLQSRHSDRYVAGPVPSPRFRPSQVRTGRGFPVSEVDSVQWAASALKTRHDLEAETDLS